MNVPKRLFIFCISRFMQVKMFTGVVFRREKYLGYRQVEFEYKYLFLKQIEAGHIITLFDSSLN